jgi:hypothetical protein
VSQFDTKTIGLIGAALGALVSLLKEVISWIEDRGALNKEKKHIDNAKMEIDFIVAWMEAASKFSGEDIESHKLVAKNRLTSLISPSLVVNQGKPGRLISVVFNV